MRITIEAIEAAAAGEAIEEGSSGIVPVPFGEGSRYGSVWEENLMKQGLGILGKAQVPQCLQELADAIRPKFPDVKPEDPHLAISTGSVTLAIRWGFGHGREDIIDPGSYNSLSVIARIASGEITVCTNKGWIPLSREDWSSPDKMAKAIIFGYNNPMRDERPIRDDFEIGFSVMV